MRVAFGCESRVGKDTACDVLKNMFGGVILHFSYPLYEILYNSQTTLGFPHKKDRVFLQWVGTEWARNQDPNCFVRLLENEIKENFDKNIFVADIRFPNELEMLKKNDFICCRIIRNDKPNVENVQHSSEHSLINADWDYTFYNNSTLEEFRNQLITHFS